MADTTTSISSTYDCSNCEFCDTCSQRTQNAQREYDEALAQYKQAVKDLNNASEEDRFKGYLSHAPGFGADGYDENENNDRKWFGLGYPYTSYNKTIQYKEGDRMTYNQVVYQCLADTPDPAGQFNELYWNPLADEDQPDPEKLGINMEMINPAFPRDPISYRDVVPEYQAERPKTIDVVFSAMISTGALAAFRPKGQSYIFITEAGLWSKNTFDDSGSNGLLAGYRIGPTNEKYWDMSKEENRKRLKQEILKVGKNQVVQVIWKIQLAPLEEFTGINELRRDWYSDGPYWNTDNYIRPYWNYASDLSKYISRVNDEQKKLHDPTYHDRTYRCNYDSSDKFGTVYGGTFSDNNIAIGKLELVHSVNMGEPRIKFENVQVKFYNTDTDKYEVYIDNEVIGHLTLTYDKQWVPSENDIQPTT